MDPNLIVLLGLLIAGLIAWMIYKSNSKTAAPTIFYQRTVPVPVVEPIVYNDDFGWNGIGYGWNNGFGRSWPSNYGARNGGRWHGGRGSGGGRHH
jgi:hypothetical protein